MDSLAEANTNFAVDLLKMIEEEKSDKNIFFSPFSISTALAMVFYGAAGYTADEMKKVGILMIIRKYFLLMTFPLSI